MEPLSSNKILTTNTSLAKTVAYRWKQFYNQPSVTLLRYEFLKEACVEIVSKLNEVKATNFRKCPTQVDPHSNIANIAVGP